MKSYAGVTAFQRLFLGILLFSFASARAQDPFAILEVHTANGTDSSYVGAPLEIVFHLDANTVVPLSGILIPLQIDFTNGNIVGPIDTGVQFFSSPETAVFEITNWSIRLVFTEATDPDTLIIVGLSFTPPHWFGAAEIGRIVVIPPDTGHIILSDILTPPANVLECYEPTPEFVARPVVWNSPTIVVDLCPSEAMGDVNQSGSVTSSDIIVLVNYIFKSGPAPLPVEMAGDADCDRRIRAGDLIHLVNYVFKSGPPPCPCTFTGL